MSDRMKLYVVSYCAFTITDAPNNPKQNMNYWEHAPDLLTGASIKDAEQQARKKLAESWPKERGWSMRSAIISPITSRFVSSMLEYHDLDILAGPSEAVEDSIKVDLDPPNTYA